MDRRGKHSGGEEGWTGASRTPPTTAPAPPSSHGSWAQDDHRAPVPARRPGLGRRLQLRLDRQPIPDHRLDEAGLGRGESTAGITESLAGVGGPQARGETASRGPSYSHTIDESLPCKLQEEEPQKGEREPQVPTPIRLRPKHVQPVQFCPVVNLMRKAGGHPDAGGEKSLERFFSSPLIVITFSFAVKPGLLPAFSSFKVCVFFRGENGNPLQCSCLENPMDRGAWWVTVHGVARAGHD